MGETEIERVVATNRKARHLYDILERMEAGLALTGTEVKSLRQGQASLVDAYAAIEGAQVFLHHLHIPPYEAGNRYNHDPLRVRKLLLNRREIRRLIGKTREKGLTLVPLQLYFRNGYAKVELALARGKKTHDRRREIAEREGRREVDRAMKERRRS
jgi:SsrA-binding protein